MAYRRGNDDSPSVKVVTQSGQAMMKDCMNIPDPKNTPNPVVLNHRELEQVAGAALLVAHRLMETGSRAEVVHESCSLVARGLGCEHVNLRSGYASLEITLDSGMNTITRMIEVGTLGVNYRLNHAIRDLVRRFREGSGTPAAAVAEMTRLERDTPRQPPWVVALWVGIACASFGRLLGIDWAAFIPVLTAGAVGQAGRHLLVRRGTNVFVVAAGIAFLSSTLGGLGARWAASTTVNLAMNASVLLLVPGVPAVNAQSDIMEGHPELGGARAIFVIMLLMFIAIGVLIAHGIVGAPS